ncbi:MAG TPA: hypothetical protein VMD25_12365 [Acidobacteriaceae bacterium]|nr:hypothetical protein [Acidobacteriaceae bacterium]
MKISTALCALLLSAPALAFAHTPAKATPQRLAAAQKETLVLPIGTLLPVRVLRTLTTAAAPNPVFRATLASDIHAAGLVAIPHGTPVYGRLAESHQGNRVQLSLRLTRIDYHGRHIVISTDTFASSHLRQASIASGTLVDFALQSPVTIFTTRPAGSVSPLPPVHSHPQ